MPTKTKKQQTSEAVETATPSPNGSNGSKPSDAEILALLATGISKAAVAKQFGIKTYFVNAAVERSQYDGKLRPRKVRDTPAPPSETPVPGATVEG